MLAGFDAVLMFLRINLITNWGKFCTCCCLGENFALVPRNTQVKQHLHIISFCAQSKFFLSTLVNLAAESARCFS